MLERVQASRMLGCGFDQVPGWYSISLEGVTGLQSGATNLQVSIPEGAVLMLARQIEEDLRRLGPPGSAAATEQT
jgi:hypothetical protein